MENLGTTIVTHHSTEHRYRIGCVVGLRALITSNNNSRNAVSEAAQQQDSYAQHCYTD
jgi:hypothetical protein